MTLKLKSDVKNHFSSQTTGHLNPKTPVSGSTVTQPQDFNMDVETISQGTDIEPTPFTPTQAPVIVFPGNVEATPTPIMQKLPQ